MAAATLAECVSFDPGTMSTLGHVDSEPVSTRSFLSNRAYSW